VVISVWRKRLVEIDQATKRGLSNRGHALGFIMRTRGERAGGAKVRRWTSLALTIEGENDA